MTKLIDKDGKIIHEINDGKNEKIKGIIQPKWRRNHWPTQLKYIYDKMVTK